MTTQKALHPVPEWMLLAAISIAACVQLVACQVTHTGSSGATANTETAQSTAPAPTAGPEDEAANAQSNVVAESTERTQASASAETDEAGSERTARPAYELFAPLALPSPNDVRTGAGSPGRNYWQQRADYTIRAALDATNDRVSGSETIHYTNNSPDELDCIWIALEQNIFRKDSIGEELQGSGWVGRDDPRTQGDVIHSLRDARGQELTYHVYDTVARIDLDAPIQSNGGTFDFIVDWEFTVPDRAFRRFGKESVEQGTIYEIAQWFPAVCVYDDVHGWNTLPYLGVGEFYSNFGDYDVSLTVPRSHIVAATGVLQNPQDVFTSDQLDRINAARSSEKTVVILPESEVGTPESRPSGDGSLTWHFKAADVRTFAWASSDAFIYDGANENGVFVQSVYPREAVPTWERSTEMLKFSIHHYSEKWFPYPYPEATNVNGPEGGMEYPMIIFCGSRRSERGLYGVTTHEIGHNWFPMLVNSDERRYAWMDEGFNTFINIYSEQEWAKYEAANSPQDEQSQDDRPRRRRGNRGRRGNGLAWRMQNDSQPPIMTWPDKLPDRMLGWTQYDKPAQGLRLLREYVLGEERFDDAFRAYIQRWAYKSPQPADFFRTIEDISGQDLSWFWRGWFLTVSVVDQKVESVALEPVDEGGSNDATAPSPSGADSNTSWHARARFRNLGDLPMPLVFDATLQSGATVRYRLPIEVWQSGNTISYEWTSSEPVVLVVVDPEGILPDVDRDNNMWRSPDWSPQNSTEAESEKAE